MSLPFIIYFKVIENPNGILDCRPVWPTPEWNKATTLGVVLTTFILPLTAIIICYGCILRYLWKGNKIKKTKPEVCPLIK